MANKKPLVGLMTCPECDFADAEVRRDKSGNLYRYCPECYAQYFTRGEPRRAANIERKLRAASVSAPEPEAAPAPEPKTEVVPVPEATPTKRRVGLLIE